LWFAYDKSKRSTIGAMDQKHDEREDDGAHTLA
jgi:hypothetical protein